MKKSIIIMIIMSSTLISSIVCAEMKQEMTIGASVSNSVDSISTSYQMKIKEPGYNLKFKSSMKKVETNGIDSLDEIKISAKMNKEVIGGVYGFTDISYRQENVKKSEYARITVGTGKEIYDGLRFEVGSCSEVEYNERKTVFRYSVLYEREIEKYGMKISSEYNKYVDIESEDYIVEIEKYLSKNWYLTMEQRYERVAGVSANIGTLGVKIKM